MLGDGDLRQRGAVHLRQRVDGGATGDGRDRLVTALHCLLHETRVDLDALPRGGPGAGERHDHRVGSRYHSAVGLIHDLYWSCTFHTTGWWVSGTTSSEFAHLVDVPGARHGHLLEVGGVGVGGLHGPRGVGQGSTFTPSMRRCCTPSLRSNPGYGKVALGVAGLSASSEALRKW